MTAEPAKRLTIRVRGTRQAEAGFTAVDHTVELFGLCPGCSRPGPRLPGEPS
jgi:Fe2+ or Zn2+ uptake regulation protein